MIQYITVAHAEHAPLLQRFHLKEGKFLKVGSVYGEYGPEDLATGARYIVLGEGEKGNKVLVSRDYKTCHFYPKTVFVWGEDENGISLDHERIEEICIKFWSDKIQRAILPNGWNKGWTWDNACYYTPPEFQPPWDWIIGRFKKAFPSVSVLGSYDRRIDLEISC